MFDPVITWLLEDDNPPVRYLTQRNLLGFSDDHPEVSQTRESLMDYSVTCEILDHGSEFWPLDEKAYWKYTGKYWQVIFLGQFLADGHDPRLQTEILKLIEEKRWIDRRGAQCLTANMLTAFMRLGFADHPVVVEETENLAIRFVEDGGINCGAMLYSLLSHCYMALPKLLLCFSQVPESQRTQHIREAIQLIVEELLEREIFRYVPGTKKGWQEVLARQPKKAEMPNGQTVKSWIERENQAYIEEYGLGERVEKPGWKRFGFPLHYNSDILEALYALARVGTPYDSRMDAALQIVRKKQQPDGKWLMDNSFNGKMWADVEVKGQPSKWITYFARVVLDCYGRCV